MENLTETCSLWESCCLSSRRGGDSLHREPKDRAKAGGNGVDPADRSASHDTLLKEGGVIQRACAQLFHEPDSGRGGLDFTVLERRLCGMEWLLQQPSW